MGTMAAAFAPSEYLLSERYEALIRVSQAIGAQIDPGWQLLAGHIVFLAILAVRPQGFFPKVSG